MFKTEVSYTRGIEKLVDELQGPLAIVHTVHPSEVEENFIKWKAVILKEIAAIEHAMVQLPVAGERSVSGVADEARLHGQAASTGRDKARG